MMQANVRLDLGDSIWMSTARNPIVVDCFRNEKRTFASTLEKYAPVMNKLISDDVERINTIIELF